MTETVTTTYAKVTPRMRKRMAVEYVCEGCSIRELAARHGTSYKATRTALIKTGVPFRDTRAAWQMWWKRHGGKGR